MGLSQRRARQGESARRPVRLHVLVSAGPTREHLDPVRYLSNESSGRMGFAIAREAAARGMRVTLVSGPVQLPTPAGAERIDVVSAREMEAAIRRVFPACDAVFMAAAVADFRPRRRLRGKWRRKDGGGRGAQLDLVANPDILARLGSDKARGRRGRARLVVGFALETARGRQRALRKLRRKRVDYIVLNDDSALNAERASVIILGEDGSAKAMPGARKERIARALVDLVPV